MNVKPPSAFENTPMTKFQPKFMKINDKIIPNGLYQYHFKRLIDKKLRELTNLLLQRRNSLLQ